MISTFLKELVSIRREITEIKIEMEKLEQDEPYDFGWGNINEFTPEYYFNLSREENYKMQEDLLLECKVLEEWLINTIETL